MQVDLNITFEEADLLKMVEARLKEMPLATPGKYRIAFDYGTYSRSIVAKFIPAESDTGAA